jgi:asparagine synthetase B (glutamine-hydrolysing)
VSAICGASGEYDRSLLKGLVSSISGQYGAVDFYDDEDVALAGLHASGEANLGGGRGGITVAVAGGVCTHTVDGRSEWGPEGVAEAWAKSGESAIKGMDGAFVCVVRDTKSHGCLAFNDFVGQVPLFYARHGGATYFSSRLAPFMLTPGFPKSLSRRGLSLFFTFGCVPGTRTIMGGVAKAPPGSMVTLGRERTKVRRHWRIGQIRSDSTTSQDEFSSGVYSLLDSSVRSWLQGTRKGIGVLLGGLDSSLVAAFIRKNSQEKISALTANFEDPIYNEPGVERVSSLLDLDFSQVRVAPEDIPQITADMAEAFEEPVSEMIASPIAFAVVKKRSPGLATLFDGTGADDLFQGIPGKARRRRLDRMIEQMPSPVRRAVRDGARRISPPRPVSSRLAPLLLSPAVRAVEGWEAGEQGRGIAVLKARESIDELVEAMASEVEANMRGESNDQANVYLKTAVSMYFGPTHGFDCSRNRAISLEYGVAVASPFYSRRLYDLGLSIPWFYKMPQGGLSKPLLRKMAIQTGLLPPEVVLTRKMGLGSSRRSLTDAQMLTWTSGALSDWLLGSLRENLPMVAHLVSGDRVMKMIERREFQSLYPLLQFALWYRRYFGEEKMAASER